MGVWQGGPSSGSESYSLMLPSMTRSAGAGSRGVAKVMRGAYILKNNYNVVG